MWPNARLVQLGKCIWLCSDTSFKRHPIHKSSVTTLPIQISKLHILLEPIIQNSAYLLCKLPCCLHYSISRHRRGVSILENDKWLPLKPFSASILFIAPDYWYRQALSNVPLCSWTRRQNISLSIWNITGVCAVLGHF